MKNKLWCIIIFLAYISNSNAQVNNTYEEIIPYREVDGKIIIRASVGGEEGDFILDGRDGLTLFPDAAAKRGIRAEANKAGHSSRPGVKILGASSAETLFIGENVYQRDIPLVIIEEPEALRNLQVDGIIGCRILQDVVLTINTRLKTITTSFPYRPKYMKLGNRDELQLNRDGAFCRIYIDGKPVLAGLDLLEEKALLLAEKDYPDFSGGNKQVRIAKDSLELHAEKAPRTILGRGILQHGVLSLDFGKQKFYFQPHGQGEDEHVLQQKTAVRPTSSVIAMDRPAFLKEVWNYRENKQWKYEGNRPMIVDFWASWCGPCMRMMPAMEELAEKYKGEVVFVKINIDREKEIRDIFNIQGIPYLLFITADGQVTTEMRAFTATELEQLIQERLIPKQK